MFQLFYILRVSYFRNKMNEKCCSCTLYSQNQLLGESTIFYFLLLMLLTQTVFNRVFFSYAESVLKHEICFHVLFLGSDILETLSKTTCYEYKHGRYYIICYKISRKPSRIIRLFY